MNDPRRYLSTFAVISLVLLRLVIGWHFFGEGTKKLEYGDDGVRLAFSSEAFLTEARGPLAGWFRSQAPGDHAYRDLLTVPHQNTPPTAEELAERAKWQSDAARRRAEAEKDGGDAPIEFAPHAPYHDWAEHIAEDWRQLRDRVKAVSGLTNQQKQQADEAYESHVMRLAEYLADESDAITEYQHELWRLANWRARPEAGEVPFQDERIAAKAAETRGQPIDWVNQVRELDASYVADLYAVLNAEQRADAALQAAMADALTTEKQAWLDFVNIAVTAVTMGVGVCLLLGLLTRLASLVGALFLLAVIATQPPWVADAAPTIHQAIELAGLLVLAGTGAGRWLGLDYFPHALLNRRRDVEPT